MKLTKNVRTAVLAVAFAATVSIFGFNPASATDWHNNYSFDVKIGALSEGLTVGSGAFDTGAVARFDGNGCGTCPSGFVLEGNTRALGFAHGKNAAAASSATVEGFGKVVGKK